MYPHSGFSLSGISLSRKLPTWKQLSRFFLPSLLTAVTSPALADNIDAPVFFQKTLTQIEALIDDVGSSDNQATARWNADGSLTAWYCGSEEFASNGERHDALMTATVFPGQSELNPQVAIHSAGDSILKRDRFNALNVCSPTIVDRPNQSFVDWTLMYFECSPMVFDLEFHTPGGPTPTNHLSASFNQVCLARYTVQDGWLLYDENLPTLFGDPETTKPTPVVRIRDIMVGDAQLADDNETVPGEFVAPIDGHIYGNSAELSRGKFYGVGHPAAIYSPTGDGQIWLYYWDAWVHRMALVKSSDGMNFGPRIGINITHPSNIKYFPDLEIDGQVGVWIGTSIFKGRRWFEYSFDGIDFISTSAANPADPSDPSYPQEEFALSISNTNQLCPVPGAGSFVSDRYGHVQGTRKFGFISGEGFRRSSEIPDGMDFCYSPAEDSHRGSTWNLYYLEGDFSDVDVLNESCEREGVPIAPNGRISGGTQLPDWDVDNDFRTGRNPLEDPNTGDLFPMAFFNNGIPMDGTDVCFLKQNSSMEQTIEGLTAGREYRVRAWVNARTSNIPGHFPTPTMQIELGGAVVEAGVSVPAVDVKNGTTHRFREIVSTGSFTPSQSGDYDLVITQAATGDATLLVDRVIVEAVPEALEIPNAGCEDSTIGGTLGLLNETGTTLADWSASHQHLVGVNEQEMAFFNNGLTVEGTKVCLLKQQSSISQLIPGFEQGKKYQVKVWANRRTSPNPNHYPTPVLRIELGGQVIETGVSIPAVEGFGLHSLPFQEFAASHLFVALASEPHLLKLSQIAPGDPTALIDLISIEEVP